MKLWSVKLVTTLIFGMSREQYDYVVHDILLHKLEVVACNKTYLNKYEHDIYVTLES